MAFNGGLLLVALLLATATSGFALLESGYPQTQTVFASSNSESPITSNTTASAIATLNFTATTICYDISNVSPANTVLTAAHIHVGASNVSGPVYVALFTANGTNPAVLKACIPVPADQIETILRNTTGFYFNAHSVSQPAGLFRGQLGSTYRVALSGRTVDGTPALASGAKGSVALTLGDTYVCYSNLIFSGVGTGNATSGDLIQRVPGWVRYTDGKVIANLFTGNPAATNCTGNLNPATIQQINTNPADYFYNINYPPLTHQVGTAAGPLVAPTDFTALLTLLATSASEIPALTVNRTAAGGTGNLTVSLVVTPTSICYAISNVSQGIAPLTLAHIHSGGPTESGPVVIPLFSGTYKPAGCAEFNRTDVLVDLVRNPSRYYFNAHNADYPAGVVRAQLGPSLAITLLGSQEVPAANVNPSNGTIIVTIGYSSVCYSNLTFSGPITNLTQGHIHNGTAGTAGDVVVPLFSGIPASSACSPAPIATLAQIVADPTRYYVNIHSTTFPAGVARQQLAKNETVLNTV